MLQGQIQQAMETFQMALVLNPQLVDAHTNLGNLYKATGIVIVGFCSKLYLNMCS